MFKLVKPILELIPVIAFVYAYFVMKDMIYATKVLMASSVIATSLTLLIYRTMPKMMLASTLLVLLLGGVTVMCNDAMFIKMKPTILYTLVSMILLICMFFNKLLIKQMLEHIFEMEDSKWRKLTIAWVLLFMTYACSNELVWRNFHEEIWVKFKLFGMMPMMVIFMLGQVVVLRKYIRNK